MSERFKDRRRMNKTKVLSVILAFVMITGTISLTGCGKQPEKAISDDGASQ